MVETLAYVADHLSYRQDAIATEAYLDTARRRVSMRRHAKLVDYAMHDGCNARVWADADRQARRRRNDPAGSEHDAFPPVPGTLLMTRVQNATLVDAAMRDAALSASPTCFETMQDLVLYSIAQPAAFYTWGDGTCSCLRRTGSDSTATRSRRSEQARVCRTCAGASSCFRR